MRWKVALSLMVVSLPTVGLPAVAMAGAVVAVPGPIAGAGLLPVLAVAGGALWLLRKVSGRRDQGYSPSQSNRNGTRDPAPAPVICR